MDRKYYVYIIANVSRTVLYTGITNNLMHRINQHAAGAGSEFSRKHHLTCLLYVETYGDARQAIAREKQIKGWRRNKKEALIRTLNPALDNLALQLR